MTAWRAQHKLYVKQANSDATMACNGDLQVCAHVRLAAEALEDPSFS